MIKLAIEPYCENCPEFEAKLNKIEFSYLDRMTEHDTIITCEHCDKCATIYEHLKKEKENGN